MYTNQTASNGQQNQKQADKYNYVYIVSICLFYFMCDKSVLLTFILLLPKPDLTGCGIHAVDYGK